MLTTSVYSARALPDAPLIVPARIFTFPQNIPGEEDALARGALWVDVRLQGQATFVAQCALGFDTEGVAHGLWDATGNGMVAVAGGYAYQIHPSAPGRTILLPLRPVVQVLALPALNTVVLVGFHAVLVLRPGEVWQSPRLSWEGVTLTGCDEAELHGLGWDMAADEEVPFVLNLHTRELQGGGYRG